MSVSELHLPEQRYIGFYDHLSAVLSPIDVPSYAGFIFRGDLHVERISLLVLEVIGDEVAVDLFLFHLFMQPVNPW